MELRRILTSRRYSATLFKFVVSVLFLLFGFSLFIRSSNHNEVITVINEAPPPNSDIPLSEPKTDTDVKNVGFVASKFISQYYEEEGIPYDNYCQVWHFYVSETFIFCQVYSNDDWPLCDILIRFRRFELCYDLYRKCLLRLLFTSKSIKIRVFKKQKMWSDILSMSFIIWIAT